jgi:hypothetical protein
MRSPLAAVDQVATAVETDKVIEEFEAGPIRTS